MSVVSVCADSVCTMTWVPLPIVSSVGMGAACRLSGLSIESGEVALSVSYGSGVLGGSCRMSLSISVLLAPRYFLPSLSVLRQYHLLCRHTRVSGALLFLVSVRT